MTEHKARPRKECPACKRMITTSGYKQHLASHMDWNQNGGLTPKPASDHVLTISVDEFADRILLAFRQGQQERKAA